MVAPNSLPALVQHVRAWLASSRSRQALLAGLGMILLASALLQRREQLGLFPTRPAVAEIQIVPEPELPLVRDRNIETNTPHRMTGSAGCDL